MWQINPGAKNHDNQPDRSELLRSETAHHRFRRGRGRRQCRQQHDREPAGGGRVRRRQHRCAGADPERSAAPHSNGHGPDAGAGRRLSAADRCRRRRGGVARNPRPSRRLPHGLHHRRHGRRHRHRCGSRHRPRREGAGDPHRRRRHQALPLRRRPPPADGRARHRAAGQARRYADRHSRTRTCSASPTRRPPSPPPSPWPTRCSIRVSPPSPS